MTDQMTQTYNISSLEQEQLDLEQTIPQEVKDEISLRMLRSERDNRLKQTDWVSGEDVPQALKELWFPYRQALRDITDTYTKIEDVVWPELPA